MENKKKIVPFRVKSHQIFFTGQHKQEHNKWTLHANGVFTNKQRVTSMQIGRLYFHVLRKCAQIAASFSRPIPGNSEH